MKTKVWLNLDPQKVDVSYLYKKFDEIGCDFEAEAIPDNNPELLIKKVKDVDIVIATMEPWNETTLGAVKGKVNSEIWYWSRFRGFESGRKKRNSCGKYSGS